jgi:hypothetical protein
MDSITFPRYCLGESHRSNPMPLFVGAPRSAGIPLSTYQICNESILDGRATVALKEGNETGCEKGFTSKASHCVCHLETDPKNSRFPSIKWLLFDEFRPV